MESAVGSHLEVVLNDAPQLLALAVGGVLDLEVATLGDDLLSGIRTLGVPPSRVGPPVLDGLHLGLVLPVLVFVERHDYNNL